MKNLTKELQINLSEPMTSLNVLLDLGWTIETNQGGSYFRHASGLAHPIPFWATQLVDDARRDADTNVKATIRHALGINQ